MTHSCSFHRLLKAATQYYDLSNFPQCEVKRQLEKSMLNCSCKVRVFINLIM